MFVELRLLKNLGKCNLFVRELKFHSPFGLFFLSYPRAYSSGFSVNGEEVGRQSVKQSADIEEMSPLLTSWLYHRFSFSELSLPSSLGYLYLIFIIVWVKEHPWALQGYHTLFASIYSRLFHRIGEAIVIYGPMSMSIQWFSFFACLPCFPSLQWSLKTPRQIISMLHQTSIVQTTDNKLNSSKRKSLPADSQGRCYLPDVWLSLLVTCLISAPSNESVLILQSRMCSVSIDSKWPLFRLNFYFICLNDFVSFKPVFMWKIQIMLSNLHFKKRESSCLWNHFWVAITVLCLWHIQHVIGSTLLMKDWCYC